MAAPIPITHPRNERPRITVFNEYLRRIVHCNYDVKSPHNHHGLFLSIGHSSNPACLPSISRDWYSPSVEQQSHSSIVADEPLSTYFAGLSHQTGFRFVAGP